MEDQIVKLNGGQSKAEGSTGSSLVQISRRRFLQILGAGSAAAGAAGCASDVTQNILPYVKPDPEQNPGVAVWYSSTCSECTAGCGIRVRTREGRAVKVEGNPNSPVNRGSLCALGQASLQSLYDPDRIRQPLKRVTAQDMRSRTPVPPRFEPTTWEEVYGKIKESVTNAGNKKLFVTGELQASQSDLLKEWLPKLGFDHVVWDPLQPVAVAKAAEMVFGTYGVPAYSIDKAEVVLNFGSDFLETWVNPVGYARQWSDSRRSDKPLRLIHVEPRLSLTGGNADMWLKANPGSEVKIALFLLQAVLERGRGRNVSDDVRGKLGELTKGINVEAVTEQTGVSKDKLLLVADYLAKSESSLVLGGGTATQTEDPLPLLVAVNLLNMVLGNVGKTVDVVNMRKPTSSAARLAEAVDEMSAEKVDVLFTYGTNPAFTFPSAFGYTYGVRKVGIRSETKKAGLVVAFSSHLDETAQLADYVLPVHTFLEDWGYARPDGVSLSLIQPSMRNIFDTKSLGDVLLSVASSLQKSVAPAEVKSWDQFVKLGYLKAAAAPVSGPESDKFWMESLERGGKFPESVPAGDRARATVDPAVYTLGYGIPAPHSEEGQLLLYPFPSVKSFDGRAANKPWMQELADPVSQAVWGSWAEIHPKTAATFKLAQGDEVVLRTGEGETRVPVYLTDHVHEGIVAVPLGQGHWAYGRYAQSVGHGSLYSLLPKKIAKGTEGLTMMGTPVSVVRGTASGDLVLVQEFNSQLDRGLARTALITAGAGATAAAHVHGNGAHGGEGHGGGHAGGHEEGHGGEHEEPKQMYTQREHPLYQWGMNIDLAACTGCSACVVACYAENNIAVVGKKVVSQGREMSWIRIERYYDSIPTEDGGEELKVSFMPMLCQHCQNAPCEPVCPVYATYHNEEGMNAMVYNRCVGTRYCSNNCSYKVRRFNWFEYEWPDLLDWQLNPDVTKRTVGVMEKCTFCVQRVAEAKDMAKDLGRMVEDGDVTPACVQTCPTQAITFGNLKDPNSRVSKLAKGERAYKVLDHHINTQPSVSYLEDIRYKA